jgi:hypothetical protein
MARSLLIAAGLACVGARQVDVSLSTHWPTSSASPLIETSEYIASSKVSDPAALFWDYVESLDAWDYQQHNLTASIDFAVASAGKFLDPLDAELLRWALSLRAQAPTVELYRQLAYASNNTASCADSGAWAVVNGAVACNPKELNSLVTSAAGAADDVHLFDFDHVYPGTAASPTVVLYGLVGSSAFSAFHKAIAPKARDGSLRYVLRHAPPRAGATQDSSLQGYGISLDIKNMEYKTLDDSKKKTAKDGEDEDDEIDGFVFSKLAGYGGKAGDKEHAEQLKAFQTALLSDQAANADIKVWDMKDLGIAAAQSIVSADEPLARLQDLSQNFPIHAKSLTGATIPKPFLRAVKAQQDSLLLTYTNRLYINGLSVDMSSDQFSIFTLLPLLRAEVNHVQRLQSLQLPQLALEQLLEIGAARSAAGGDDELVRIDSNSDSKGAVAWLNNVEKDKLFKSWSKDVQGYLQATNQLPPVRKNAFNLVVVLDPATADGAAALATLVQVTKQQMPIRIGVVFTNQQLQAEAAAAARDGGNWPTGPDTAAAQQEPADVATAWHAAKVLAKFKKEHGKKMGISPMIEQIGKALDPSDTGGMDPRMAMMMAQMGQPVPPPTPKVDGPAKTKDLTVAYGEAVAAPEGGGGGGGMRGMMGMMGGGGGGAAEADPAAVAKHAAVAAAELASDDHDKCPRTMAKFVHSKGLPVPCFLMNGVVVPGLNIQQGLMQLLGSELRTLQLMVAAGTLKTTDSVYEKLLEEGKAYPRYHAFLDQSSRTQAAAGGGGGDGGSGGSGAAALAALQESGGVSGSALPFFPRKADAVEAVVSVVVGADLGSADGRLTAMEALKFLAAPDSDSSGKARLAIVHNPASEEGAAAGAEQEDGEKAGGEKARRPEGMALRSLDSLLDAGAKAAAADMSLVQPVLNVLLSVVGAVDASPAGATVKDIKAALGDALKASGDAVPAAAAALLEAAVKQPKAQREALAAAAAARAALVRGVGAGAGGGCLVLANGRPLHTAAAGEACGFLAGDYELLTGFERSQRADKIAAILRTVERPAGETEGQGQGGAAAAAFADQIQHTSALLAEHHLQPRVASSVMAVDKGGAAEGEAAEGEAADADAEERASSSFDVSPAACDSDKQGSTARGMKVVAVLDPLSASAQRVSPLLHILSQDLGLPLTVHLTPKQDLSEFPLKNFYRYVAGMRGSGGTREKEPIAAFEGLPKQLLLTLKVMHFLRVVCVPTKRVGER